MCDLSFFDWHKTRQISMEFALEPESTETLQATLAFIDETLGDSSPNTQAQSPDSDDWEMSCLLDDFLTDISSNVSSPRVAADLAIVPVCTPPSPMVTLSLTPDVQYFGCPGPLNAVPTSQPTRKKRRSYNPNKAREELQRELKYLRTEAEELELKLHQLQSLKAAKTKDGSSARQLTTTQRINDRTPFVWEQTCARQLECRLRSERKNAHLKLQLEGQIQVAKSLEKLLNTRKTLYPAESSGSKQTTRIHVSRSGNEVTDAAIFEELADGVEASYREVERVFASTSLNVSSRKAQMRDGKNGMFLEIFDSKVLPFSMHATGEAWWRRWNHFNPNRGTFGMAMSDAKAKTTAKFYVQQILRRYVEEQRVVVVWQSHIEPLEFSHKKLAGIRFREKGYVVIKPLLQVSEKETYTLVQTCHIIKPNLSHQRLKKDARTGALAEFVLSATVANIAASAEMIEGLLVDEALQQRSRI
ncbi:hypothetical protein JG688_00017615 [Phytophthora aleatoria]|uniref:M96 mating-specific protein family n=1 Tax=Phytophthora aleatoria TaxID=2496075 RepID=A0A8J5ISE7_9STRA|nr:hypothetical protein JG688_00017615 [Phytophthora aleatoria]